MTLPLLVVLLLNGCAEKEKFIVYGPSQNGSEVEALIKEEDYVERSTVIHYDDSMLVAVQIKPWEKWKKTKLEKKLQKNLMRNIQIKMFLSQLIIKYFMKPIK